ncbi:MAG TPA: hypothetical protein VJ751_05285 [Pyrinomonadaceae bacterium]|nr:hypothetical protein [Pyrinomonadaceae bacterium]
MLLPAAVQCNPLRLVLLLVLLLISATLIWARWKTPELRASNPIQSSPLETELITITPAGFEPAEIARPQGRFMLAIDNRSGLEEVDLYLERETEGRVNLAFSRKGKLAWRDTFDFPPGVYILRAANDESWRCRISITPR